MVQPLFYPVAVDEFTWLPLSNSLAVFDSGTGRAKVDQGGSHATDSVFECDGVERAFLPVVHMAVGCGPVLHLEVEQGHQRIEPTDPYVRQGRFGLQTLALDKLLASTLDGSELVGIHCGGLPEGVRVAVFLRAHLEIAGCLGREVGKLLIESVPLQRLRKRLKMGVKRGGHEETV